MFVTGAAAAPAYAQDAAAIVKSAVDYWCDVSSYSLSEMTIHRPDWERRMTIRHWATVLENRLSTSTPATISAMPISAGTSSRCRYSSAPVMHISAIPTPDHTA